VAIAAALLTAKEYLLLPDNGQPTELVRGRVVTLNIPTPRHGQICAAVVHLLCNYLEWNDLGRVVCNDSGVVTERDPDTVRGSDVAYYSYDRVAPGPLPWEYLTVVPELVIEVLSPTDGWGQVLTKVGEYLKAGVGLVCVLDDATRSAYVYRADRPAEALPADAKLSFPEVLPEFRVAVGRFFD
jgi:Uma2 family endonuclease